MIWDDVYLTNLATGSTVLASTTPAGVAGNSQSFPATISGDGTAIGIYAWAVELLDSEGKPRKATGHVTLLR
ncbi:MAG TPA: hypothetical protein PKH36_01785, partial [Flavobacteriales bacterium]|nr:hypothetical protein [Flavobacteriales bacterium]